MHDVMHQLGELSTMLVMLESQVWPFLIGWVAWAWLVQMGSQFATIFFDASW
jgi:hypothetical protein